MNFDDAAAAFIPFETLVTTGTYRPTNFDSTDAFPTPAPAGPYGTTLGVFNEHNPNGTWALYVVDDAAADVGQLPAGWSLGIETSDPLPPTIEITSPADGAQYLLNHPVNADYGCTDETGPAGVVTCAGPVPTGTALAASTVGLHTFTVTAEDVDGNSATRTHNYSVVYPFSGFLQPVDNAGSGPVPVVNTAKAGSAIPVKFRLGGNQGLAIFPGGTPVSKPMNCDGSATADPVEQTVTAGSSSLQYDATTDTYTYVWKTEKRWAATCRVLFVTLNDGTEYPAYFRFTK